MKLLVTLQDDYDDEASGCPNGIGLIFNQSLSIAVEHRNDRYIRALVQIRDRRILKLDEL